LNAPVTLTERCCGEAGTFAISRPDIATQVRFSKQENLQQTLEKVSGSPMVKNGEVKLLTSCPACQQGLSRYQPDTGLTTDYIVVELAKQRFGDNWSEYFAKKINAGGVEKILL
jgi:Fe-S oxidoreductase